MHRLDWFFGRCCVASKVPSLESVHTAPECVPGPNVGNHEDEAVDTVDVGETPNLLTKDRSGKPMLTKGLTFRNGHRYKRRVSEMPNDEDARTFYAEAIEEKIHAPGRGPIEGMQVEDLVRMLKKLKINDLDTQEVQRIFEKIPKETPGRVSMLEFLTALKTGPASISLKNFISRYRQGLNFGFDVSQDYDYSKPTCENYKMDEKEFFGDYREIRQDRDYTYHVNYIQKRQIWQDRAIASIVHRTGLQADPWLVYTCGPMGVGKGYAMSWMSKHGFFPLENIVHVDPDAFKLMMPEWPGYTEVDKENAGTMCHMESSFMMEIAQEAAMQRRQNIWIDGSLRNADFYSEQFKQVRSQYPFYRIAIFYVTAPEEMVRARIAERARATGRDVPEHLIQASLNSMDKSLNMLTPLCDFVVRVSNEGAIPILKACETIDTSGSWEVVTDRLARKAGGPGSFPNALQPQTLGKLAKEHMRLLRVDSTRHNMMVDLGNRDPENPIHEKLLNIMPKVGLTGSIIHITGVEITPISIPDESRQLMGIPREAETSFFLYPHQALAKSGVKRMLSETGFTELESISSLLQLLSRGGFGYCDTAGHVVSVDTFTNQEGHALLQFDKRQTVSEEALPDNLFMPTPARYREATSYAFVPPGKMFGEHCVGGAHGALVFRLKVPGEPSVVSFPVMAD